MEETAQKIQTGNDDEVLVKQADGSFKLVRVSDLGVLKPPVFQSAQKKEEKPATASAPAPVKQAPAPFVPSIQVYDRAAGDLIKKSGLVVPPELLQRFKIIIISRLKDIRKLPEARERLLAAPALGGVGLKPEEAERVVKMVEESMSLNSLNEKFVKGEDRVSTPIRGSQRGSVSSQRPPLVPPDRGERLPPSPPAPPKLTTFTPINQLINKPASPLPVIMPPKPAVISPKISNIQYPISSVRTSSEIQSTATPSTLKIVSQAAKSRVELAPIPPAPVKPTPITAIPQTLSGRAKVEDVAYKPRLVGPLEELREMTLIDFRRLAPQAKVTTDKIYAKIELLAGEGYAKKIKGVEAWQKSPVSRIYLMILNESIVQGKPVDKVIGSKETLSKEEFQAIMDLNRRLRF